MAPTKVLANCVCCRNLNNQTVQARVGLLCHRTRSISWYQLVHMTLGQVFLQVLQFFPISTNPPVVQVILHSSAIDTIYSQQVSVIKESTKIMHALTTYNYSTYHCYKKICLSHISLFSRPSCSSKPES